MPLESYYNTSAKAFLVSPTVSAPTTLNYENGVSPNYNIVLDNSCIEFEIYLAGYKKDNLKLYSEKEEFFVSGHSEVNSEKQYLAKNVILKPFKHIFNIPKNYEFESSKFVDGILYVKFKLNPKESPQHKEYPIE